jgi:hypothetical protein
MARGIMGLRGGYHGVALFRNTVTNKRRRIKAERSILPTYFIAVFPPQLAPLSPPSCCCPLVGFVVLTMKSFIFSIVTAALFVAGVSAQLTVNTPSVFFFPLKMRLFKKNCFFRTNVVSCSPLQVSFTGGTRTFPLSAS